MDLLLTVVRFGQDAESGEDVLVSAPEESTVADLAQVDPATAALVEDLAPGAGLGSRRRPA